MRLTINHNGFHGFTRRSIVVSGKPGDRVQLSPSQVKRLARVACGMNDCCCGESLLDACIWEHLDFEDPVYLDIPATGTEIKVRGHYPQR